MNADQLLQELSKGHIQPLYLLEGEEPFFIDQVTDFFEHRLLPENQRAEQLSVWYGRETTASAIRQKAMTVPLFAERQYLVIKQAQEIKQWDELVTYFQKPVPHTVLVLCYVGSTFDRRTKAGQALKNNAVILTTRKLYENELHRFVQKQALSLGLQVDDMAVQLLVDYIGNDLARLDNELKKLKVALGAVNTVTTSEIEQFIGISRQYNGFELCRAIGNKDVGKVFRIVSVLTANTRETPLVILLGMLHAYFVKLYQLHTAEQSVSDQELATRLGIKPFLLSEYKKAARHYSLNQVQNIFSLLTHYDARLKGVRAAPTSEYELARELVYRILFVP